MVECGAGQSLWLPYVEVPEIHAATRRAEELGAQVTFAPREGPAGWRASSRPRLGERLLCGSRSGEGRVTGERFAGGGVHRRSRRRPPDAGRRRDKAPRRGPPPATRHPHPVSAHANRTSRSPSTDHSPSRHRTCVPSASRADARPSGGVPQSVASSGRSDSGVSPSPSATWAAGYVTISEPARTKTGIRPSGAFASIVPAALVALAGPEVDPVPARQRHLARARARLQHRRDP